MNQANAAKALNSPSVAPPPVRNKSWFTFPLLLSLTLSPYLSRSNLISRFPSLHILVHLLIRFQLVSSDISSSNIPIQFNRPFWNSDIWRDSLENNWNLHMFPFWLSGIISADFRSFVGKLQPPVIPFMPLLLKDMTFAHEGNKTSLDGLVNFEKMHMMAQTMRTIRFCRSRHLGE